MRKRRMRKNNGVIGLLLIKLKVLLRKRLRYLRVLLLMQRYLRVLLLMLRYWRVLLLMLRSMRISL